MPHDKNGAELKVGDKVTVEFVVEEVNAHPDHCNLKAKTVEPFHPNPDGTTTWFNTKQVVKIAAALLVLLLLGGDALAAGRGCPTCSSTTAGNRGGLLGGIRDRIQERREGRAGGCQQSAALAFPGPEAAALVSPVTYYVQPAGGYSAPSYCPNGRCPVQQR